MTNSPDDEIMMSLPDDNNEKREISVEEGYIFHTVPDDWTSRKRHKRRKRKKIKKVFARIGIVLLSLLVALALTAVVFTLIGRGSLLGNTDEAINVPAIAQVDDQDRTLTYNGVKYKYNENTTAFLLMGVDKSEFGNIEGVSGTAGQSDLVMLAVLDVETGKVKLINIPRDTMTEVNVYSPNGTLVEKTVQQLCLAYAYGDSGVKSCENTIAAVSNLLYGVNINSYFALDLSSVAVLNDAVGGIELTALETIPGVTTKGQTASLTGKNVLGYVRYRDTSKLDSSLLRMERQKQYLEAFSEKAITKTKQDISTPITIYNSMTDYMVTDIDASKVAYVTSLVMSKGFDFSGISTVKGEMKMGDNSYAEFYPDEEALFQLFLDTFYTVIE